MTRNWSAFTAVSYASTLSRNAAAVERCAHGAQATDDDCSFNGGNHHGGKVSKHDDMPDHGNDHEDTAKEPPSEAAPEGAALTQELDPVSYVIKSNDLSLV